MNNLYLRNRLCYPVRGINRSIIYDLTREDYWFIPNELYVLLSNNNAIELSSFPKELDTWVDFLLEQEIIFPIYNNDEIESFPMVDTSLASFEVIFSLILVDTLDWADLKKLSFLSPSNISIIVEEFEIESFIDFLRNVSTMECDSIDIFIISSSDSINLVEIEVLRSISQVFNVHLFKNVKLEGSPIDLKDINVINHEMEFEEYTTNVHPTKLRVNSSLFFEALQFHNYFYKKMYIDKKGNILNGLTSSDIFGNISHCSKNQIRSILKSVDFNEFGTIEKNQTLVCKDCEFKYMCVDPRVPRKNKDNQWYHIEECNYNPYVSKWKGEKGYKTLRECGILTDENGYMSIDEKHVQRAFENIWR